MSTSSRPRIWKLRRPSRRRGRTLSAAQIAARISPGRAAVRRVGIALPRLPAGGEGARIVQVADVHAGPYMGVERMHSIRDEIAELEPDLVVFTGDQVDRRPSDARLFADGFRGVEAPLGVYGILGNHDHFIEPWLSEWALVQAGIEPLINRSVTLERGGDPLLLAGVDDLLAVDGRGPDFGVVHEGDAPVRVCLCHHPAGWAESRRAGADLTLAGHTHGGQINLSATLNAARFETRYIAGLFRHDGRQLYVSRGLGVGALPIRLGAPPELDLIELTRG